MTSWIKVKGIPFTILGLGCLLTIFLYLWSVSSERARGAAEFAGLTEKFRTELSARVQSYIDTLPGLKAFVVLEKNRSDLQFQQFVSTVSLQKRFPGIALTFIADRVLQSNLDAYVTAVRADDSEQKSANRSFTVQPPGLRSEYMIVRHASPETPNTVGYDLYDPTKQYRKEVDQAAASGQPTATPPVTLARDRDAPLVAANASVLVRLAVYSTIGVPNTQAQRAQALIGMAGVAFKTRELIASVLSPEMETRLKMQILDLHAPESQSLVFDTNWLRSDGDSGASPPLRSVLRVANREWTVIAVDRQAAQVYWTRPIPILVLIFGLSVSFLLSLLLRSLVQATAKAETSVEQALDKVKQEQIALEEAQSIARMGSWKWDVVEKKLFFSAELVRILEIESDQFLRDPNSFYSRIPQALREQVKSSTRNVIDSRQPLSGEFTLLTRSGETLILHGRSSAQCDEHGHLLAVVGTVHDITRRKQIEAMASAEAGKYRQLFENSLDGVMQTQTDGKILAANPAACDMFGCTESQLITMGRNEVIDPKDERLTHYLAERELTGKFTGELRMLRLDGTLFDAEITSCVYQEEGSRHLTSLVIRDISERKMHEREIERLAFTDGLTGLPNRRLLFDRGTHAIAEARRSKILGALLFIDLDHFKVVNDAVGHATGDALLCEVAERLRGLVREGDTVARLGGDEFVILLTGLARTEEEAVRAALLAAERIRQVLETPFVIETRQFSTGASIGISLFPNGDQTYLDVLREADTAMYRAKAQGRHRAEFFVGAMQREVEERFAMEHALERAIRSEGLFLVAQSQFDAQMQQCGVELLLRWNDENGMPVPPAKFIPLAENLGLINVLGEWVIEQGCKSLAHLQGLGLAYSVSVNVSPRQFHQPDFVARVSDALMRHRITPGQLIFEVTENLLIDNVDEVIDRMERLTQLGIKFSIDDFGTGYSSLAYLQKLPLYELKIDKIFLRDLPSNKNNAAIVHLILDMAGRLGLRVVAEGVENADQFDFLVSADCRSMQGFMLAKPLALAEWLAQKTKDAA